MDIGLIFLASVLLVLVVGLLYFVTLIHILINDEIGFFRKVLWIVVMIVAPVVGMILYYLIDG